MKTQCPSCNAKFNINEQSVGKKTKCPKCAQPFTIEPFAETPAAIPVTSPEPVKDADKPTKEKSESKNLSKTVFVYCWAAAQIIAGALGLLGLMLALRKSANPVLIATFAAGNIFLIGSVIIELLMYYKMWNAIQDSEVFVSPGKAVGFLFVPIFNIYWALSTITGFAEDYNEFIRRNSIKTKDLPFILFFVYAAAFILSMTVVTTPMLCVAASPGLVHKAFIAYRSWSWFLSCFALAAGVAHFITYMLFATKTCDAINALQGTSEVKN